jgi:cation-transporting P-type ATPase 13A2
MIFLLTSTGPFVTTTLVALAITVYMVLGPTRGLRKFMQLTKTRWDFELFLLALGIGYFIFAWGCETFAFAPLARFFGQAKERVTGQPKKRKRYKAIQEAMQS